MIGQSFELFCCLCVFHSLILCLFFMKNFVFSQLSFALVSEVTVGASDFDANPVSLHVMICLVSPLEAMN